jgi:CheY-like chemotaxis protein
MSSRPSKKQIENIVQSLCVLVVDDNQYMRKMIRTLLVNCGVKDIYEAADGIAALDAIRTIAPDVVILDWEMPLLSGAELVRIVRSPGVFPMSDVPIIMLSGHGERWRIVEAARLGVNEFLIKPFTTDWSRSSRSRGRSFNLAIITVPSPASIWPNRPTKSTLPNQPSPRWAADPHCAGRMVGSTVKNHSLFPQNRKMI